jgi:phosphoglycolate phosphatase-like HAD superfamily hydrolase
VKKLIVFDLDGTLAESKSSLDAEMSALLHDLLGIVKVAVISGGDWPQFEKQLLSNLPHDERLVNGKLYSPKTAAGLREVDIHHSLAELLHGHLNGRCTGFVFRSAVGTPLAGSLKRVAEEPTQDLGRDGPREVRLPCFSEIPCDSSSQATSARGSVAFLDRSRRRERHRRLLEGEGRC